MEELDFPCVLLHLVQKHVESRRLARPIRTHQPKGVLLVYTEGEVAHCYFLRPEQPPVLLIHIHHLEVFLPLEGVFLLSLHRVVLLEENIRGVRLLIVVLTLQPAPLFSSGGLIGLCDVVVLDLIVLPKKGDGPVKDGEGEHHENEVAQEHLVIYGEVLEDEVYVHQEGEIDL